MNNINSIITGLGAYLPENIKTNDDIAKIVETNNEWIISRTGITQRYIANKNETTAFMGAKAGIEALNHANISASQLDFIIVATTTPDNIFPSVATNIQKILGANHAACFDVQAVCAGFVYILSIADSMIKTGQADNILIIGSERMSDILNWKDRTTCILFGDGAGAFVLSKSDNKKGVIASKLYSDGSLNEILYANSLSDNKIVMEGSEVFKHAVSKMSDAIMNLLYENNINKEDISAIIPHQANSRIIDAIVRKIDFPSSVKVANTVSKHANTSAASIPLSAYDMFKNQGIKSGDLIVTTAIGGGMCWGANLFYL